MFCMICQHHVSTCVCHDIKERLASLSKSPVLAIRMCRKCGEHYARCRCAAPDWYISGPAK